MLMRVSTTLVGLTCHLHDVTWDNVSCFNPLDTFSVLSIHFAHLWFIFFKSFNSIFSIPFLKDSKKCIILKALKENKPVRSDF